MTGRILIALSVIAILYLQQQQLNVSQVKAREAQQEAQSSQAAVERLQQQLDVERQAAAALSKTKNELHTQLSARLVQLETLKHENQQLRDWAAVPLPDAAARLRQRQSLSSAKDYRDWLSRSNALPASGYSSND